MKDNTEAGLMHPGGQHGQHVAEFAGAILGKPTSRKNLDESLADLSAADRDTVTRMARYAKAIADMAVATKGYAADDYSGYLKQLNKNLQPNLQALAAEVLNTIAPLQDVRKPALPDHDAISKSVYEQYLMKDVEVDREEIANAVNQRMRRGW